VIRFPFFPVQAPHLEFEMTDVPIVIGSLMFGPVAGIVLTTLASVIQGYTVSAQSGPIGILMHFIATGTFAVTAGIIYKFKNTLKGAIMALICGTLAMAAIMIPANLTITVHLYHVPVEVVKGMLFTVIVPFNLLKAGINSIIIFFVYKPLKHLFMPQIKKQREALYSK
jgi:riboflavin transporter FmnP